MKKTTLNFFFFFFFVMILFYPGQISNKDVCSPSLSSQKVVSLVHSWLCSIQIYIPYEGFNFSNFSVFVKIVIKMGNGFPPASGQILLTSDPYDWLNGDPHLEYS